MSSRHPQRVPSLLLVAAFLVGPTFAEDLAIVSNVTVGDQTTTATQFISAGKVRSASGNAETIVDYATGRMIHIDNKKHEYFETTLEELRAQFEQVDQMLRSNPMMEKMLGGVSTVDVQRSGRNREIAGYTCEHYLLTMGRTFTFDLWVTPELEVPAQFHDASKMSYAMMGPVAARFEKVIDAMKEIKGLSLATTVDVSIMGMNIKTVSEATEVRKGPLPADAFEPPAGYKKTKSPFQK